MEHVRDRIAAVFIFALAAAAWWTSQGFTPGARMVPQLVAGAMLFFSFIMFVRTFLPARRAKERTKFFTNGRYLLIGCALALIYISLVAVIGYFTATALFVPVFTWLLGYRRPAMLAISTMLFLLMVYVIFVGIFDRPLPDEFFVG